MAVANRLRQNSLKNLNCKRKFRSLFLFRKIDFDLSRTSQSFAVIQLVAESVLYSSASVHASNLVVEVLLHRASQKAVFSSFRHVLHKTGFAKTNNKTAKTFFHSRRLLTMSQILTFDWLPERISIRWRYCSR